MTQSPHREPAKGWARPTDQALAVPAKPASGLVPSGFDPSRIGDLPERLFTHSLELISDDEEEGPSALFNEIQDAALLLAEIRNGAGA